MITIIFFNIPHLSVGRGGEVWEREVIEFLNSHGFKAKLITTDCCYQGDVKTNFEYKVIKLKKGFMLHLYDFHEIKRDIDEADLVYYFNSFIGSQIPLILHKKMLYKKIIFGYHAKNDWNLTQRAYYSLISPFMKDFGYHHVLTKHYYNVLVSKGFKRVFTVPNFVDTNKFRPSKKEDRFTIIAIGVTSREKGLDILLEVADKLRDVNIYLAGKGLPKDVVLPKNVTYLGYIDDESKVKLLSSSHLCLLPTRGETFSITLLECLATGNLAVTTDLPELREVSGNIPSVFLAKNSEEFAVNLLKIKELYERNREKFQELSQISVKRAYSFEKNKILDEFEKRLISIYNEIQE